VSHPVPAPAATVDSPLDAVAGRWSAASLEADDAERHLVEAALRCIARWGVRKTSLDDIAREAGVSRATAYRVFPGGKERLVEVVVRHEAGRAFHAVEDELRATDTLGELMATGITAVLRLAADHPVLGAVVEHEPELVLPHFAFHQLDRVLAVAEDLCRPHLGRFLPADEVAPAADLLARVVLTYAFRPTTWVDVDDPASVRRLVDTYLLPSVTTSTTPATATPAQERFPP
jgi:TetR/AcrR family transcriptional repressor of uid operon